MNELTFCEKWVIVLFLVLGIGIRLFLLTGPVDYPDWRQTENAYTAWRMYQEPVPDLWNPKVPYRGAKDVSISELPLHAAAVALVFKVLGRESLMAARVVTMATFLATAYFLFRILSLVADCRRAWYSILAFFALPLSIFYSRAHHYEFTVLMFSYGFLFFALRFFAERRVYWYIAAMFMACWAFLMKPPLCAMLWLPLFVFIACRNRPLNLKDFGWAMGLGVLPLTLAIMLNEHRIALHASEVESVAFPMKFTHKLLNDWFFGALADRFEVERWILLGKRLVWDVLTPMGVVAALMFPFLPINKRTGYLFVWSLGISFGLGALLLFRMVASPHDYYSVFFLPGAAVLIGWFLAWLVEVDLDVIPCWKSAGRCIVVLSLVWAGSFLAIKREHYFSVDWQKIKAGETIAAATSPDALVISVTKGRSTGYSDPRILYYAHRRGWAIEADQLKTEDLEVFNEAGANMAALLLTPDYPPVSANFGVLTGMTYRVHEMIDPRGKNIGCVVLFPLER